MQEKTILPISVLIPTRNRDKALKATLESIIEQDYELSEIIIIDTSDDIKTESLCLKMLDLFPNLIYHKSPERGAAVQRNLGFLISKEPYILFMDDDVILRQKCIYYLWNAIEKDDNLGGVSAMIENQKYQKPGRLSSLLFSFLNGKKLDSYAGKCIGPALNLLPEDDDKLPSIVTVEWLNLGCVLYRRVALPSPPFLKIFKGYSIFEDLALSLQVGKNYGLANVRIAKIFHDSQPGDHKNNLIEVTKMEFVNRHYIMTKILQRANLSDYIRLFIFEFFSLASSLKTPNRGRFLSILYGKLLGLINILK